MVTFYIVMIVLSGIAFFAAIAAFVLLLAVSSGSDRRSKRGMLISAAAVVMLLLPILFSIIAGFIDLYANAEARARHRMPEDMLGAAPLTEEQAVFCFEGDGTDAAFEYEADCR